MQSQEELVEVTPEMAELKGMLLDSTGTAAVEAATVEINGEVTAEQSPAYSRQQIKKMIGQVKKVRETRVLKKVKTTSAKKAKKNKKAARKRVQAARRGY